MEIPCGNMIEPGPRNSAPECAIGYNFGPDCPACSSYSEGLTAQERTRCEIWSRVMGYHRPVSSWNPGKQAEHANRVNFKEPK